MKEKRNRAVVVSKQINHDGGGSQECTQFVHLHPINAIVHGRFHVHAATSSMRTKVKAIEMGDIIFTYIFILICKQKTDNSTHTAIALILLVSILSTIANGTNDQK